MRHVLSALVQNVPGVLSHVAGMMASRGFNIDSLAVGATDDARLARMTFVVAGDDTVMEQARKQLEKLISVIRVDDISGQDYIERDLMLVKVKTTKETRSEIIELAEIFRGRVVDVTPTMLIIEISGRENKIESFIDVIRPYGILELARTGRVALLRCHLGERKANGNGDVS